ncbi:hypothetical protein BRAS3809_1000006 [Bradyrhizobium sp. STM 3809]|nr:hypothetical protein BRAS3809_1000006 [Bradyrhizobium sp. STM 3809]
MSRGDLALRKLFRPGTVVQAALIRGGPKAGASADEKTLIISLLARWHSSCSTLVNDGCDTLPSKQKNPGRRHEGRGAPCVR